MQTLTESAPWAAQHLNLVVQGKIKSTALRVDVCRYVINQVEGAPKQKHDVGGHVVLEVKFDRNELGANATEQG